MVTSTKIPFELHITVGQLPVAEVTSFTSFCLQQDAKPLLIELARGEYIHQPMLNKVVYLHSLEEALLTATRLSEQLTANNWQVQRLKIEIPASHAAQWNAGEQQFQPYFEWHGKVQGDPTPALNNLCQLHRVHLSINAFKKEDNYRFITLREFGIQELFRQRVDNLINELIAAGWPLIKDISEYCIYDNNVYLDKGWLPQ